jgi:DNA-binding response OmpR family regulator
MYQILLVEDSADIQALVAHQLSPIAEVTIASSVAEALRAADVKLYDLFLLDVELGDGDGFALTSLLKKKPLGCSVPFIFMTSRGDITDKTTGFNLGAEDYIVKPFHPTELRLRIENRLQKNALKKQGQQLVRGNLRLDVPLQKAFLADNNLLLTPLEFKILYCLVCRSPDVVAREQLIESVWGSGVKVGRSVDTHVNSLRGKLGSEAHCIHTVYGLGYRFTGPE